MKKSPSTTSKLYPLLLPAALLLLWQFLCVTGIVPAFMLPSPVDVVRALVGDAPELLRHTAITLGEAFSGLGLSILVAALLSILMEEFAPLHAAMYPLLIVSQTIPTIAMAPLLVLWMGFGALPKVTLVFITCLFPLTISMLGGLRTADADTLRLMRSMGANRLHLLFWVKLPYAADGFFAGLKVSTSYAVVGAVVSEWLGGHAGLGVYMTRVRKAYAFDKMFAVILVTSVISLLLLWLVGRLQKAASRWKTAS